ncbi:hypothetical protein [Fusobacterium vincentii ATCC 49256]|jgi:hypothetical protein|uniref:Uncharacterized protein n=1 Tax=Fusobacterium vincentii ATCC 49256 TaxID=209882 RepID=Q7P517_FUSVC|nr:hypothetical protein [Fusobacterium sp. oral taxon 203]EAA23757.1 hypothetical protein [Fusobacterium vincentii ATCC 49256]
MNNHGKVYNLAYDKLPFTYEAIYIIFASTIKEEFEIYEKFVNDFVKKNNNQSLSIDFNIKNIDEDIAYIIFSITMNNKK